MSEFPAFYKSANTYSIDYFMLTSEKNGVMVNKPDSSSYLAPFDSISLCCGIEVPNDAIAIDAEHFKAAFASVNAPIQQQIAAL